MSESQTYRPTAEEVRGDPKGYEKLEAQLDELLTHLIEEASEVIQACTKMRRFGPGGTDPRVQGGRCNHSALAFELGQLSLVWEAINGLHVPLIRDSDVQEGRESKFEKLGRYLEHSRLELRDGHVWTLGKLP